MKTLLIYLLSVFIFQQAFGQVSGRLADTGNRPIAFASISLLKSTDSTQVKAVLGDEKGSFQIGQIPAGKYLLKISSIGYLNWYSPVFELTSSQPAKDLGSIVLSTDNRQLGEVVIRGDKPPVEQQQGGLVVNVQNSILTKGSSVLEVLERSPGVIINPRDNSITLNGKGGVMVMLDGKLMRMSMDQIAALLNGMRADNVEKIELLNTPPAQYDADGNAGLINIVTKKSKKHGTNGSFTATAGYGKGEKASTGISINHNAGNVSLNGSYSYSHDKSYAGLFAWGTDNEPAIGGQTAFDYNGISKPISNYQNAIAGIDVQLSPKTTIGGGINYSFGSNPDDSHNYGTYTLRPDSVLLFNSNLNRISNTQNLVHSFYFEKDFSKDEKINFDADYIYYKNTGNTEVQSSLVDNHGNQAGVRDSLYSPQQRDLSNTIIRVGVVKADYSNQISPKLKLEAGAKGTYTRSSSISGIENMVNGDWVLSTVGVSNNLSTKEIIGAAYATLNAQIDTSTNLVIGARYEYSHNSTDKASDSIYNIDRKLGKLFPSVFFSKKLNDHSDLQLSYTERVTRPSYSELASYVTYNDPVSVSTGNPALKPTITRNFKIGYGDHNYLFSILFSRDDDLILQSQITTGPSKGLVYLAPENAPWQNHVTFQATAPVRVNDWWDMSYGFVGGLHQYKIDYTPTPFEKTYFGYSFNFAETYKLPKSFSFEISGYYNSLSWYSTSKINATNMLNLGIKKELNDNKGSFQLSVSNLLRSETFSSYIGLLTKDVFNSQVYVRYNGESANFPIIKLSYYRSFGIAGSKSQRKAGNGSKEEQDRL